MFGPIFRMHELKRGRFGFVIRTKFHFVRPWALVAVTVVFDRLCPKKIGWSVLNVFWKTKVLTTLWSAEVTFKRWWHCVFVLQNVLTRAWVWAFVAYVCCWLEIHNRPSLPKKCYQKLHLCFRTQVSAQLRFWSVQKELKQLFFTWGWEFDRKLMDHDPRVAILIVQSDQYLLLQLTCTNL